MPGLKITDPAFAFSGARVTPDEIDRYEVAIVANPQTSATWFGTTAAGTSTEAKAMVIINKLADYSRNLAGGVAGTSDMGGVWVVNGKNQFGALQTETITVGSAANGGTTKGTGVFAEITSGTFTFTTGAIGSGTPKLGVDTVGTSVKFGLLSKIGSTADVKAITWINNGTPTTLNGGTIGAYVGTAGHFFRGTADVTLTDRYHVTYRPSYNAVAETYMANL